MILDSIGTGLLGGACEQQIKKSNCGLTDSPLGYECSIFGLPDTRDGQNKKRSAQNKKAELEK
jgi:hypothetical protein